MVLDISPLVQSGEGKEHELNVNMFPKENILSQGPLLAFVTCRFTVQALGQSVKHKQSLCLFIFLHVLLTFIPLHHSHHGVFTTSRCVHIVTLHFHNTCSLQLLSPRRLNILIIPIPHKRLRLVDYFLFIRV